MGDDVTPEPNGKEPKKANEYESLEKRIVQNAVREAKAEGLENEEDRTEETSKGPDVDRILSESKNYKKRAQAAERRLKEFEESQLKENEKWKEAYEKKANEYESLEKRIVQNAVQSEVRQAAIKAGCIDPDAVVRLGDLSSLEYDPETNSVVGVDDLIQSLQAGKSYLFAKPTAPVTSGIPKAPKDAPPEKPTMSSVAMELVSKKR